MKKNFYRLLYLLRYGSWYYVWVGIADKILGHENARKLLHKKTMSTPPEKYEKELTKIYTLKTGKNLNLKNPLSFNEKIQWLKLYDATALKTRLADKYLVRDWIKDKIGEQYLIPILGVWDKFEDIKIDELPNSFALKANHGSGWNIVVPDKSQLDRNSSKEKFENWLSLNSAYIAGFQMHYRDIPPKIIAEQYIENDNGNLYDYKIYCFNGKPEYIQVVGDRNPQTHKGRESFYDTQWVRQPFTSGVNPPYEAEKPRPDNLDEMLRIAEKLSQDFIFVRVDLYKLDNDDIKFGEMTFTPNSGFNQWTPPKMDMILGEKIKLPL